MELNTLRNLLEEVEVTAGKIAKKAAQVAALEEMADRVASGDVENLRVNVDNTSTKKLFATLEVDQEPLLLAINSQIGILKDRIVSFGIKLKKSAIAVKEEIAILIPEEVVE